MTVDSNAFLPRALAAIFDARPQLDHEPTWTPFDKPLSEATIGLLSSGGIFLPASQESFDMDRERREPQWGDPSLRMIPSSTEQSEIDASHLHINTTDITTDVDVALPIHRLNELAAEGTIGRAASEHFSVMGYQQEGAEVWRTQTAPEIAARCHAESIDALILAPA